MALLNLTMLKATASPGGCWTLNTSEWMGTAELFLNDAGVSSLSDILETGEVPPRYYLTAKACSGILRRAAKRDKELPPALYEALMAVAMSTTPAPHT